MNRYVVISSNAVPDYEFYVPIVRWAWKQFGWETICLRPFKMNGYREETVTQVMRLYAADYRNGTDCLLMTSDADMIPLSDYWDPHPDKITCYGHDLTGYKHQPMCYIAMSASKWREVMDLTGVIYKDMHRDLEESKAKSDKWEEWWQVDQDIITDRLSKHSVITVDRGLETGSHLPLGRMDRAGMKWPEKPIDFHAPKNPTMYREAIHDVLVRSFGIKYERSEIVNYVNGKV
jgi:hypothetical protein